MSVITFILAADTTYPNDICYVQHSQLICKIAEKLKCLVFIRAKFCAYAGSIANVHSTAFHVNCKAAGRQFFFGASQKTVNDLLRLS